MLEITINKNYTFTAQTTTNGLPITVSSCTVSIKNCDGETIVDSASATILAGSVSYTFLADDNDTIGMRFTCEFTAMYDGSDYPIGVIQFDVATHALVFDITDEEIFDVCNFLRLRINNFRGSVIALPAPTTTTIYDDRAIDLPFDYDYTYNVRTVESFDRTTGAFTFSPALTEVPTVGDVFYVQSTFSKKKMLAYNDVRRFIRGRFGLAARIIDISKVRHLIVLRSIWYILLDLMNDSDDIFGDKMKIYDDMYEREISNIQITADMDNNGSITDEEAAKTVSPSSIPILR